MASSKKGKKNKGKTLALIDFLQDTPGAVSTLPIRKSNLNWADEVEDSHDSYESRSKVNVVLPTAPKASRDFDDLNSKVPNNPPYIAYISNLPYDVEEEEISSFFGNLKISSMRIPKDERPGESPKLKGFGYIEFEDRESLLNALSIPDTTIKHRRIRIEVATDFDNDKKRNTRGGGSSGEITRDRPPRSDVSTGDWRSGPRSETVESERRTFGRDRDRSDDTPGGWRDSERTSDRDNDRTFSRTSDKYDRDYDRSDRDDRQNYSSRKYDNDRSNKSFSRHREESEVKAEPRQRPRLVLAPRTKPVESTPESTSVPMASIFGNAKPVDTSARERQIEEKLAKESEKSVRESSKDRMSTSAARDKENSKQEEKVIVDDGASKQPSNNVQVPPKGNSVPKKIENDSVNGQQPLNIKEQQQQPPKEMPVKKMGENEKKEYVKNNKIEKEDIKLKNEKPKREEKKVKTEKAMPKVKKVDPPNFIANNKFAFLQNEDNSD